MCEQDARDKGLLVIDLSDAWTPLQFQGIDGGEQDAPSYRSTYLDLADERTDKGPLGRRRYLEPHGILPTLRVVLERLRERERHQCHDAIDDSALDSGVGVFREESFAEGRARLSLEKKIRRNLEMQRERRGLAALRELGEVSPYYERQLERLGRLESKTKAIEAMQNHLRCDALLQRASDGILSWNTSGALRLYQRRNFLRPTAFLDPGTRQALKRSAEENDVRTALRVLRERVAEAASLIEDGSASDQFAPIVGRVLDDPALVRAVGAKPLANAAPDRIGETTNRVAVELGWRDADSIRAFLERHAVQGGFAAVKVAVSAPPEPSYHSEHMELEVVIDPGDTRRTSRPTRRQAEFRPTLTIYAIDGARRIPLVRWPTTVGGWQDKRLPDGGVVKRYMGSVQGDVVWRDLYVEPRWLPPDHTPGKDVIKRDEHGKWRLDRELLGPSYRSAYGLGMLVHHKVVTNREKEIFVDRGIRTHGTGNTLSLARSDSHGCHRLLGLHINRLSAFLLRHRRHERRGIQPTMYKQTFHFKKSFSVSIRERGYLYELTPPVPVRVGREVPAK